MRQRGLRNQTALGGALVLVLALPVACGGGDSDDDAGGADTTPASPTETTETSPADTLPSPAGLEVDEIPLDGQPAGVSFGADAVWVTIPDDETVLKINPQSGAIEGSVSVDGLRQRAEPGGTPTLLWVTIESDEDSDEAVVGVDPADGRVVEPVQGGDDFGTPDLAWGLDSAWILGDSLMRVVPGGTVGAAAALYGEPVNEDVGSPGAVAAGTDSLWVLDYGSDGLLEIAPGGEAQGQEISLEGNPTDVAFGEGSVWVASGGLIFRLDPDTGKVVETIETPATDVPRLAVGGGALWVVDSGRKDVLYRVDVSNP